MDVKNQIVVDSIDTRPDRICVRFSVRGTEQLRRFFLKDQLSIEYSSGGPEPMPPVPESVAVIPFVCLALPIAWLTDAQIVVDELDRSFYESIDAFRAGYAAMYPQIGFKGGVSAGALRENVWDASGAAVLFSGGLDSFHTLLSHMDEHPRLVALWGADVAWDNEAGWRQVLAQVRDTARQFHLPYHVARTDFRAIIDEWALTKFVRTFDQRLEWWHDFQHGIGIVSHVAPLALTHGVGRVYIASSFTPDVAYTSASDPTIEGRMRFGSGAVIHDGYHSDRQTKLRFVCSWAKENGADIPLRVCWQSRDGRNCCACEKCYRTMMGLLAEGEDPRRFGFPDYDETVYRNMLRDLRWGYLAKPFYRRYHCIQQRLRERYPLSGCPRELRWFYKLTFSEQLTWPQRLIQRGWQRWKRLRKTPEKEITSNKEELI